MGQPTLNVWLIFSNGIALFLSFPSECARISRFVITPMETSARKGQGVWVAAGALVWEQAVLGGALYPTRSLNWTEPPAAQRTRRLPWVLPSFPRVSTRLRSAWGAVATHTQGRLCSRLTPASGGTCTARVGTLSEASVSLRPPPHGGHHSEKHISCFVVEEVLCLELNLNTLFRLSTTAPGR